jgi:hypothetical protein
MTDLNEVHARLATEVPECGEVRAEVDYVSVDAIKAVERGTAESPPITSVTTGEPLHEVEASRHSLLNWAAALQADRRS